MTIDITHQLTNLEKEIRNLSEEIQNFVYKKSYL